MMPEAGRENERIDRIAYFGWLGLREPGAVFSQRRVAQITARLIASEGRSWSRIEAWGESPPPFKKEPCAFSLHLLHGVWGGTISRADVGRTGSFQVHSQAKCAKIPRRETHNKFRLQVGVPAGYTLEDELLGVDVGGAWNCTSLETIWKLSKSALLHNSIFFVINYTKSSYK